MTTQILTPAEPDDAAPAAEDGRRTSSGQTAEPTGDANNKRGRGRNRKNMMRGEHPHRPSAHRHAGIVWTVIALVVAVSLSIGLCALFLPDRAPALLQAAPEITSTTVSTQMYSDSRQVTLLPRRAADRTLLSAASGTVTASPQETLTSGKAALGVDGRPIIALASSVPVYRDLSVGDTGQDAAAVNTEMRRLGYAAPQGQVFTAQSRAVWRAVTVAAGGTAQDFHRADVLWIPAPQVSVTQWSATLGGTISEGDKLGVIPGALQRLDIRGGQSFQTQRRLNVYGQSTTLPAGQSSVSEPAFLQKVAANPQFSSMSSEQAAAGITATVTLPEPLRVLRVPAGAVFGITGTKGCIARPSAHGRNPTPLKVEIVGGQIGVSLVRPTDPSVTMPARVALGSALAGLRCR